MLQYTISKPGCSTDASWKVYRNFEANWCEQTSTGSGLWSCLLPLSSERPSEGSGCVGWSWESTGLDRLYSGVITSISLTRSSTATWRLRCCIDWRSLSNAMGFTRTSSSPRMTNTTLSEWPICLQLQPTWQTSPKWSLTARTHSSKGKLLVAFLNLIEYHLQKIQCGMQPCGSGRRSWRSWTVGCEHDGTQPRQRWQQQSRA